jgi:lipid-A-disaccharide synthase
MFVSGKRPSLLVVAGEASGDLHGANAIARLREKLPSVGCFGLGGQLLVDQGLDRIADPAALNVVGITEVLKGLHRIRGIFQKILAEVDRRRPTAALLIDLPDFNLRLAKKLKSRGIPVIYYVAPQAWAWRKGRVRQIRKHVTKLCAIFPFEEPFFLRYQIPVEFVGHPLTEVHPTPATPCDCIALVPGSRPREVERLLPPILGAAKLLKKEYPSLQFVIPVAPSVDKDFIRTQLEKTGMDAQLVEGGASAALKGSRLALIASGTATLEAALLGVPMVVVYRVSTLTYMMVRPIYQLPHVCIVNILAGCSLVPELLQGSVTPKAIARAARVLVSDGPAREEALRGLGEVARSLGQARPSERVAEVLLGVLGKSEP